MEKRALTGPALTGKEEREAEARRRASNFLQAMRNLEGDQSRELPREDYGRRRGKEPVPTGTQAVEEVTPLEHAV